MPEYIEREAALDIVNGWREQLIPIYGENDEYVKCLETVAEHLESLHAAYVRPVVRGKWIEAFIKDGIIGEVKTLTCSACGYTYGEIFHNSLYIFCPNCGADMREES